MVANAGIYHRHLFICFVLNLKYLTQQKAVEANRPGATIIPIIISTDKTQVTLFRNKSAYPVYMTIGNLPKDIRRKPSRRGYVLIGYLPTTKLEHITNKAARHRTIANLFHSCVGRILAPLAEAGIDGIAMKSGDGVCQQLNQSGLGIDSND